MTIPSSWRPLAIRSGCVITPASGVGLPDFLDMEDRGGAAPSQERRIVADWRPGDHVTSRQIRRMSRISQFVFVSAVKTLESAGHDPKAGPIADRIDTYFCSTHGATGYLQRFHEGFINDPRSGASPTLFSNGVSNAPSAHVSLEFGMQGRSTTFVGGGLSPFDALFHAGIRLGEGGDGVLLLSAEEVSETQATVYRAFANKRVRQLPKIPPGLIPCAEGSAALLVGPSSGNGEIEVSAVETCGPEGRPGDVTGSLETALRRILDDRHLSTEDPDAIVSALNGGDQDDGEMAALKNVFSGRKRDLPVVAPSMPLGAGFCFATLAGVAVGWGLLERGTLTVAFKGDSILPAPLRWASPDDATGEGGIIVTARDADGSAGALLLTRR